MDKAKQQFMKKEIHKEKITAAFGAALSPQEGGIHEATTSLTTDDLMAMHRTCRILAELLHGVIRARIQDEAEQAQKQIAQLARALSAEPKEEGEDG